MDVKVRYFASLRDRMGKGDESVSFDKDTATVADLWSKVSSEPMPESILVAVNMEYTDSSHELKNGDEVAFFPPVTGG
ncbi:MAG: molybdopterin converting factor subunit 1 [Gammaproteobacteria bacterium]|nr:molybdopterin converting factor subunit 1 [Gammaproteobacteria bacterium]